MQQLRGHDLLRIRLPRVNDVVDRQPAAEIRTRHLGRTAEVGAVVVTHATCPIRVFAERLVVEVKTQMAQLPELVAMSLPYM